MTGPEWARAHRWGRWSFAGFLGALVLTVGMIFVSAFDGADAAGRSLVDSLLSVVVSARTVLFAVGVLAGVLAISAALTRGPASPPPGDTSAPSTPHAEDDQPRGERLRRGGRMRLAAVFAVVNLAAIAAGALHILVWNPLARVPGASLERIYADMAAVGEGTLAAGFVSGWALFCALATLAYLVASAVPLFDPVLSDRSVAVLGLLLIGVTSAFAWAAGFNMGMSLADTFATSGAPAAVSGPILSVLGQFSIVGALFLMITPRPASRRAPTTA